MMDNRFPDNTLFVRWVKGKITDAERQALEQHPDYPAYRRVLESARQQQLSEQELGQVWQRFRSSLLSKKSLFSRHRAAWSVIAVAAILSFLLLVWSLVQPATRPPSVFATTTGEKDTVELPDGTTVSLNAVSCLEVYSKNWSAERRVRLTGEAFFQVPKGHAPFVVETAAGTVSVLGTSFNVRYRGGDFEVDCYAGWVQATTGSGAKQALRASQKSAARNGRWQPLGAITDSWPSWMQGETYLADVPVYALFAELERQYNISISASGTEGRRFSGTFSHDDLPRALRMVCEPLGLQYVIEGKEVLIRRKD